MTTPHPVSGDGRQGDHRRSRVGVVGGGLAGQAAALALADAGAHVVLLEARARLGGVAGSFRRGDLDVDTGQHVFLRCCTAYRRFLHRIGAEHLVTLQDRLDIAVRSPTRSARLRRSTLPAPLHLAGALLRYGHLSPRERLGLVRAALALGRVDRDDPAVDAVSFGAWLAAHGQGARAVDVLWDVVGIATLNARAQDASLALAATVFQLGLLDRADAGDIGWATAPLGALHDDAAHRALTAAGVEIRRSTKVAGLRRAGGAWLIETGAGEETAVDRVVVAVPPAAAVRILPAGTVQDDLGTTPIVNVHVVYDRRVLAEPFVAGVDSPVQWVFDRTAQSGAAAVFGPAAQYLAVSLSAANDLLPRTAQELREHFVPALAALLPAARDARVLESFVTREPHATFRGAPGQAARRSGPRTAHPGLYLAGAWTATGWPATMEGAVRSGAHAAEALLQTDRVDVEVPA
ncbi:squalene-associated FAD-dependent desaturase [Pseudonocardia oroxyli]|uniref:Squalene-associated FAD-dependent desaturase n=1 Tax=Pseudonocardia oroxyli TaxID=366584 RepID=A0A1G7I9G9_PSEOR|nr:squalene-associated FAD-dependent desaturase [Pseudonocardia oroxyli]